MNKCTKTCMCTSYRIGDCDYYRSTMSTCPGEVSACYYLNSYKDGTVGNRCQNKEAQVAVGAYKTLRHTRNS